MNFKTPCHSCGQNIAFPEAALGLNVDCPHCGNNTLLSAAPTPPPLPMAAPAMTPGRVAGACIVGNTIKLGATVYQLSQVNSVKVQQVPFRVLALLCLCIAGSGMMGALLFSKGGERVAGAVFWGVTGAIALARFVECMTTFQLVLTTSSGEVVAMSARDRKRLDALALEIGQAIAAR